MESKSPFSWGHQFSRLSVIVFYLWRYIYVCVYIYIYPPEFCILLQASIPCSYILKFSLVTEKSPRKSFCFWSKVEPWFIKLMSFTVATYKGWKRHFLACSSHGASLMAQTVKHLPAMRVTRVQSLGWEDPLEKETVTHSSILASRIPWTEESGRLQSWGHKELDTTERLSTHTPTKAGVAGRRTEWN